VRGSRLSLFGCPQFGPVSRYGPPDSYEVKLDLRGSWSRYFCPLGCPRAPFDCCHGYNAQPCVHAKSFYIVNCALARGLRFVLVASLRSCWQSATGTFHRQWRVPSNVQHKLEPSSDLGNRVLLGREATLSQSICRCRVLRTSLLLSSPPRFGHALLVCQAICLVDSTLMAYRLHVVLSGFALPSSVQPPLKPQ
jgi:hypothetical protein